MWSGAIIGAPPWATIAVVLLLGVTGVVLTLTGTGGHKAISSGARSGRVLPADVRQYPGHGIPRLPSVTSQSQVAPSVEAQTPGQR